MPPLPQAHSLCHRRGEGVSHLPVSCGLASCENPISREALVHSTHLCGELWHEQATYQHRQVSYHRQAAGEVRSTMDVVHLKQLIVSRPKLAQAKLKMRGRHRVQ
jgi:hypothetical protein